MKYSTYIFKRRVEDLMMYPLIVIGRWAAKLRPLQTEYDIYFFFPFYHTGGAEKVHALVAQAIGSKNSIIYFTKKSDDDVFYKDFLQSGCEIKNISGYTASKWLYWLNIIYRGKISAHINRQQKRPLVFNGQCNFAYKISPWINDRIPQVELIHSYNTFSWIRLPFLPFISKTIMISNRRIQDHLVQYEKIGVPATFNDKIVYIVNGVPLPPVVKPKKMNGVLQVLYAGRGTEEKRVHLVAQIARQCKLQNVPVQFVFMGDVQTAIPADLHQYFRFLGQKSDPGEIDEVYQNSHFIIITSYTEGFPMVIEEGMARGCIVIATPVGDIPWHVKPGVNGFLFSTEKNEELIVKEGAEYLSFACTHKQSLEQISRANIEYAKDHFSIDAFNNSYRQLYHQLMHQN